MSNHSHRPIHHLPCQIFRALRRAQEVSLPLSNKQALGESKRGFRLARGRVEDVSSRLSLPRAVLISYCDKALSASRPGTVEELRSRQYGSLENEDCLFRRHKDGRRELRAGIVHETGPRDKGRPSGLSRRRREQRCN